MIPELRLWLLWWVWAVVLNATGVLLYAFDDGEEKAIEVWLEVRPTSVPPTDTVREVTITAKLSHVIGTPLDLPLALNGATLDGKELTLTVVKGETVGEARFVAPSLPQGAKPDFVTVAVKESSGRRSRPRLLVRTPQVSVAIIPPGGGTPVPAPPDAWIGLSHATFDAATTPREVTLTGFLSVRPPTAIPLAVELEGLGEVRRFTLTIPANEEKASLPAVAVPVLPPGGSSLALKARLVADDATPARYRLVPERASASATVVAPPITPDPVVPVWLDVTPKELAAGAADRAVTVTVRTAPDPDKKRKADLPVAVKLNSGDLSEGDGFSYADPERKAFVIPAGATEVFVVLTVPAPKVAGADKKLTVELQPDPAAAKRYAAHLEKPQTATVEVRAAKPEYKILLTVSREVRDGDPVAVVTAIVNGGKPVPGGKLAFKVVADKLKEKDDFVLDGAEGGMLPVADGKGQLRLRLPHNPDLPPSGTVSVRFDPVPDFQFAATKDTTPDAPSEVAIETKPDYTRRKLLLLVVASDLLFAPNGTATEDGTAFADALKPILAKHRESLVGGGLYLIPCPTEALANDADPIKKMSVAWRGRCWTGGDAPFRLPVDDKFQPTTKKYNLHEPCQAFLLARQGLVARLAESAPAKGEPPFTLVLWPSRDAPGDFNKSGAWLRAEDHAAAAKDADGRIELAWLGLGKAPPLGDLTALLKAGKGFDDKNNLVWSAEFGKAATEVGERVSKLIEKQK